MSDGITETSIQELLGLSDADVLLIDLKIVLKAAVKKHRLKVGMTQKALAELIDSSQSRIAKLEGGDSSVSIDMMINCLFHMGVKELGLASIVCPEVEEQLRRARQVTQNWSVTQMLPTESLTANPIPRPWQTVEMNTARANMFNSETPRLHDAIN